MEIDFARDVLAMVQAFLTLGLESEQVRRVILARLYYAAHHVGRLLLRNAGLDPDQWRQDVHQQVLDELEHHFVDAHLMSRAVWRALRQLRFYRIQADYELTAPIRIRHVRQALDLFLTYFKACERLARGTQDGR
jgi:uncharacterized protein (UPF0332 family)